ncbi:hypothetical protein CHI08_11975, partial [Peribacillus simplex]
SPGETPQAQGAEEAPGPPAESECLEWRSNFYTDSKKLWTKGFLSFNTKLIGMGVRDSCGEKRGNGDPAGAPWRLPDRPLKASAWSGDLIFTPTQKKTADKPSSIF